MNNKKTTWIECRNTDQKGTIGFYLLTAGQEYFLFVQKFRHGVWNFYKDGVKYENAIDYSKAHRDRSVNNVMQRIRLGIEYLEKYENVYIPERAKGKGLRNKFVSAA